VIVSRAAFVKLCGAAIVGGSLPRWALPGDSLAGSAQTAPVETGASRFRPHIGSLFTIDSTGQRVRLSTIVETAVSPDIEQFALNFVAPAGTSIPHGIYTLRHSSLGSIDMFITPVGAPGRLTTCQACFSIVRAKDQPCRINS
jgi:hypothetical protein